MKARRVCTLSILVLCSCSEPTRPPEPPVFIELISSPSVTIPVMHVFPVRVRVTDGRGRAVPNVPVVFPIVRTGQPSVPLPHPDTVLTDANGEAGIQPTLGPVPGHYVIFPEVVGPSPIVDARQRADATVVPDSVAGIELTPDTGSVLLGDSVHFTARAVDRFGNTVSTANVNIRTLTPTLTQITTTAPGQANAIGLAQGTAVIVAEQGQFADTVRVPVLARVSAGLALGTHHSCNLFVSGAISCWGAVPAAGAGGEDCGAVRCLRKPQAIVSALRFEMIAAGGDETCAVSGGAVYCWGRGRAVPGYETTAPLRVPGGSFAAITSIAVGRDHACVTTTTASFCWGDNSFGQLGTGDRMSSSSPSEVLSTERFSSLRTGPDFTCGVTTSMRVYCWGANSRGELGRGMVSASEPVPDSVRGLNFDVTELSQGAGSHVCVRWPALHANLCWGNNDAGQIASGIGPYTATPRPMQLGIGFVPATTSNGTCATDGKAIWCIGSIGGYQYNDYAVLSNARTPTTGDQHACVRPLASNGIYCWGDNAFGALGDGTLISSRVPVAVAF